MPTASAPARWPFAAAGVLAGAAMAASAAWALSRAARPDSIAPSPGQAGLSWPMLPGGGPHYRRVTFSPGDTEPARFGADGHSVIYTLQRGHGSRGIVRTDLAQPSQEDLGVSGYVLSVSRAGEIAYWDDPTGEPIVQRVLPGASGPRAVAKGRSAAFGPDGHLAILRTTARGATIEDPVGTVIAHPTNGVPKTIVHSRGGELIAATVHTSQSTAKGRVAI